MRILAMVYQDDAGPGVWGEAIQRRGVQLDQWPVPEEAGPPADPAGYDAVMTFGGAMHAHEEEGHPWLRTQKQMLADLIARGTPLLGACLGAQILCVAAGGQVRKMPEPEIAWIDVELTPEGGADPLLGPMAPGFAGFNWHSYECLPPEGAAVLAKSSKCIQAFRVGDSVWGIQFHAEVSAADAGHWMDDWREDAEAVRMGLDVDALREETNRRIAAWNEAGRALCDRFLDAVTARSPLRG
jgi:GMP synthase (glutamine-hydrolysing)